MLNTLTLRGYRGFESYRMPNLTRVNLVVGRNNCGKTSILEAIELLVACGHVSVFYGAARRRGDTIAYVHSHSGPTISNLFFGYEWGPGSSFELSSEDHRMLGVSVVSLDELGDVNWPMSPLDRDNQIEPAFGLSIVSDTPLRKTALPLTEDGSIMDYRSISQRREPFDSPVQFIALDSFASASMGRAWNDILTDGREAEIVEDMGLLLPDIDSIHFLTSDRPSGSGILIGRRGTARRTPIGSYGDGMRRLLAFRLALAGAANGFVLIDEIDAGLHWTVMEDLWRLLGEVAERSNVQIFATTHSHDCIHGLGTLVRTRPQIADQFSIHKLDQSLPQAVSLHGEHISVAVDQDIEVR